MLAKTNQQIDQILEEADWLRKRAFHQKAIFPWTQKVRARRRFHTHHPIEDFLLNYYNFPLSYLEKWTPGPFTGLQGKEAKQIFPQKWTSQTPDNYFYIDLNKIRKKEVNRIRWIRELLEAALKNPPIFNCYGLHEWAMVYKTQSVRHQKTPLRMPLEDLAKVVESQKISCSHYDAFRFFSQRAIPLNTLCPKHDAREKNEQTACIHFNMDLYKWSYKIFPWISSDFIQSAFKLAKKARSIDMQASPYNLEEYDLKPIKIETPKGKLEYIEKQRAIRTEGITLAKQLISHCKKLESHKM